MREIDFASAVAEYLQCSEELLADLRTNGTGPFFFKIGKNAMYRKCDVDSWIEKQLVQSTSEYFQKKKESNKPS